MTHAPGPWTTTKGQYSETLAGQWLIRDAENIYVAHAHPRGEDGVPDATADANARLIAAAPELLAELIETANWLDERAAVVEKIGRAGRMGERPNAEATAEAARLRGRAALIRQTVIHKATQGA